MSHSNENPPYPCQHHVQNNVSRRDFLRLAGVTAAGLLVASCKPSPATQSSVLDKAVESGAGSSNHRYQVAIGKADSYDRELVRNKVAELIDHIGGLGDVISSGDSVAIKVNLTGGVKSAEVPGYAPIDSFVTHPEVVRAMIEQVKAAGAKEIFIVEAVYEWASYTLWGYEEIADDTGVTLIDLNNPDPYKDFTEKTVGENDFIYEKFVFNQLLQDVDKFISISKLKNHYNAGVTHTMKNLYGLVPLRFYNLQPSDNYRSAFHGAPRETRTRLPRVIMDLNQARKISLGLVDGIKTSEAGEGPWIATMTPIHARVLLAGKNPVATDAVATAVMGQDPTAEYPNVPFFRCDNHLNLAAGLGLGSNQLSQIDVLGTPIADVVRPFIPCE